MMNMHAPMAPAGPDIPLVDNLLVPDILVGGVTGLALLNGIITVTLDNLRCDHTRQVPQIERTVVARLNLSVPAAQAMLCALHQFLSQYHANPLAALTEQTRQ